MLPFILFLETLCFAQLGVGFLKGNIQWISWLLPLLLGLLPFDLELAIMPAMLRLQYQFTARQVAAGI